MELAKISETTENEKDNPSVTAIKKAQVAFKDVAAELNLNNEEDVQALVDELRKHN